MNFDHITNRGAMIGGVIGTVLFGPHSVLGILSAGLLFFGMIRAFKDRSTPSTGSAAGPTNSDTASSNDRLAKLEQAARLHQQGLLTEAEFEAEKRRLLP